MRFCGCFPGISGYNPGVRQPVDDTTGPIFLPSFPLPPGIRVLSGSARVGQFFVHIGLHWQSPGTTALKPRGFDEDRVPRLSTGNA